MNSYPPSAKAEALTEKVDLYPRLSKMFSIFEILCYVMVDHPRFSFSSGHGYLIPARMSLISAIPESAVMSIFFVFP